MYNEFETPDTAPAAVDTGDLSLFDELKQEAAAEFRNLTLLPSRRRPGWVLEFDAQLTAPQVRRFNAAAKGKRKDGESDARISNAMVLIETNTRILKDTDGEGTLREVLAPSGGPLVLTSIEFLEMMGQDMRKPDTIAAVNEFLSDAGCVTMGAAVLKAAGWSEDLTPLDPTDG